MFARNHNVLWLSCVLVVPTPLDQQPLSVIKKNQAVKDYPFNNWTSVLVWFVPFISNVVNDIQELCLTFLTRCVNLRYNFIRVNGTSVTSVLISLPLNEQENKKKMKIMRARKSSSSLYLTGSFSIIPSSVLASHRESALCEPNFLERHCPPLSLHICLLSFQIEGEWGFLTPGTPGPPKAPYRCSLQGWNRRWRFISLLPSQFSYFSIL